MDGSLPFDELCARWQRTVGFTDVPLDSAPPGESYRPPAPTPDLPAPAEGYRKLEAIGSGGQGIVFRAVQTDLLRDVAIKQLRVAHDEVRRADFLRESITTGQLEHPNILPIHRLDLTTEDQPTLVMKLVDGQSWEERLRAREPELRAELEVLIQVCHAVAYAHSRGIVHNDLKPANVMLGRFGEVLVLDWGLAADLAGDRAWLRPARTIASPCGTPSYSPPELAEGRGDRIGTWTDVYLLGGILFRLLNGCPPHGGETLLANLRARCASEAPHFAADAPRELVALCQQALAEEPEERPSAEDFREGLRAYLRHAESLRVARAARDELARLGAEEEAPDRFERYSEAIAGFRQALTLWEGNREAAEGEREARAALARSALASGDLALARGQASRLPEAEGAALLTRVAAEEARLRAAVRARRRLRVLAVGLAAALLLSLSVGLVGLRAKNSELRLGRALEAGNQRLQALGDALATRADSLRIVELQAAVRAELEGLAELEREFPEENALPWLRGRALTLLHEHEPAWDAFSAALALPDSDWSRGVGVRELAHYGRARGQIQQLLSATLAYSYAALAAGLADGRERLLPAVREDLERAGRSAGLAPLIAGWQALLEGRLRAAAERADEVLARGGPSPEGPALAALVALEEHWPRAVPALDRALTRDANQPVLLLNRARIAWRQGRRADAFADVARACWLAPGTALPRQVRVQLLVIAGRFADARAVLATLDDPLFLAGMEAEIALGEERYDEVLGATAEILAAHPGQTGARRLRVEALLALGERDAAREEIADGLALRFDDELVAIRAGLALEDEAYDAAREDVALLLERADRRARSWKLLGRLMRATGEPIKALHAYGEAVQRAPGDAEARFARAELFAETGQPGAALPDLDWLLERRPGHAEARALRLRLREELGSLDEALEDLSALIAAAPRYDLLERRLELHRQLARWTEALADLAALEEYPEAADAAWEIRYVRADLHARLGDPEASLEALDEALAAARNAEQRAAVVRAQAMMREMLGE